MNNGRLKFTLLVLVLLTFVSSGLAQVTTIVRVNVTSPAFGGVGVVSPSATGITNTTTVSAATVATPHPSSGSGDVIGHWQLYVTCSAMSHSGPSISGYFQYGYSESSTAYAANHQSGASASGSSYTLDTSNSASVGIGVSNPLEDDFDTATPYGNTNITSGATMGGSGSSWTYTQDIGATEAYATGSLTGTFGTDPHATGSGAASEEILMPYSNITVLTN